MWKCVVGVVFLSACATSEGARGAASCGIAEPAWPAAPSDWDRPRTQALVGSLVAAARDDREQARIGRRDAVGGALDALARADRDGPGGFVSRGVFELGVRLRQLDCAVRRGVVDAAQADARYAQILAELDAERGTLGLSRAP